MSAMRVCGACGEHLESANPAAICPHCGWVPPVAIPVEPAGPVVPRVPVHYPPHGAQPAVGPSPLVEDRRDEPVGWRTDRRRSQGGGFLSTLIGVVGGGVIGVSLGYWLVLYFGGPDFLNLRDRLPEWARPGKVAQQPIEPEPPPPEAPFAPRPALPIAPGPTPAPDQSLDEPAVPAPEPTPEPAPPLPPPLGPRDAVPRSMDELGRALADANGALGCRNCNSTGKVKRIVVTGSRVVDGRTIETKREERVECEVCQGRPPCLVNADSYASLCSLAEAVTFVEVLPGDQTADDRKAALKLLLVRAGRSQDNLNALGRFANAKLRDLGRSDPGIALAGTVQEVGQEGDLFVTRLVLFGMPNAVTVLSRRPAQPALSAGDRVLILGTIVDDPQANLVGYSGSLPQIVWGGFPVKLTGE